MDQNSVALDASYVQLRFFTKDERLSNQLPKEVFNVPVSSEAEQLNILINKIGEKTNVDWKQLNFDFLVNSILIRVPLIDFIESYNLSFENVLALECIQQSQAPVPQMDLPDSEWVADVKSLNSNCIASINYGGELVIWDVSMKKSIKEAERGVVNRLDEDPLKCLDVFVHSNGDISLLVGTQNQTVVLLRLEFSNQKGAERSDLNLLNLTTRFVLRGHQRSVECVSFNKDGSRAVSGSFDKCVKVWNIDENDSIDDEHFAASSSALKSSKKPKIDEAYTKTPMVTLQAHREAVVDIAWNPLNAGQAVSVSWDHQILVWDLELAGPATIFPSNRAFTALSLNSDNGILLTSSTDSVIRMWDLRSKEGSLVKSTYCGHRAWVSDVCWSPNSEHLFCSASFDETVKMWDIRSPKAALYDLMGHKDRVLCVDWTVAERIASGSVDCSVKVFSC